MTALVDGKTYSALPFIETLLIDKVPRQVILSSILLFAGFVIFAPSATAQRSTYIPARFTFKSIFGRGEHQCSDDNLNGGKCHPAAFSDPGKPNGGEESPATLGDESGEDSKNQLPDEKIPVSKPDFNRDIYYKNKFEFSQDVGWLPINIPFPLDVFTGDAYQLYPLKYTLVPILLSLRWHIDDIKGPVVLRGNWDLTMTAAAVLIPRGPETRYFAYIMGIRRNFVPRNWRVAPYFDIRLGLGDINARAEAPYYVQWAQGQDFTFTINSGSGLRYNFNPRFAASVGLNWMHISNMDLSEPAIRNTGINVYGPMFGIDIRVRMRRRHSEQ
jgi:lipid A 3-O-deacylase PagL